MMHVMIYYDSLSSLSHLLIHLLSSAVCVGGRGGMSFFSCFVCIIAACDRGDR